MYPVQRIHLLATQVFGIVKVKGKIPVKACGGMDV
jgi:hypothetical protein